MSVYFFWDILRDSWSVVVYYFLLDIFIFNRIDDKVLIVEFNYLGLISCLNYFIMIVIFIIRVVMKW